MFEEWFIEKLNSCYHIKKNGKIYWVYNKNEERKKKLCEISNEKYINPNEIDGYVLFEQCLKENDFIINYLDIKDKIKDMKVPHQNIKNILKNFKENNPNIYWLIPDKINIKLSLFW